ncbi:MAG: polyprenyl synthetase family protein [Candidatus Micrarchaeota archaeon]|nr:polyprenyl synthetase family protein [Candidatus Micrarchaeota archaeon]
MDFKGYVETHKERIYSRISEYLKVKDPIQHYRSVREYSDRKGGYRRPGMIMLTGQMFGAEPKDLILPAAVMQVSEDWILIHDDIEDNSELRRGKPALQKMYGIEIAINSGDALHIIMWRMLKDYLIEVGLEKGSKIFDKFYDILEFTVEGQFLDNNFIHNTRDLSKGTEEIYYRIVKSKTCYYSLYGPMQIGAMIAGKGIGTLEALKNVGEPAGIAFQITDDILDMTADEKVFGKQRYGDLYEGKLTLIMLHTYGAATVNEKEAIDKIYAKDREKKTAKDIDFLVKTINKYDGLGYAVDIAERYGEEAKKAIEDYKNELPDNEYREIMLSAIEEMYKRKK